MSDPKAEKMPFDGREGEPAAPGITTPEEHDRLHSRQGPLAWMAQNSVAANLLMLILVLGGLLMVFRVRQEVFPNFALDVVNIQVPYPGASPDEVEQGIVLVVEEAVRGVDGVEEVIATANEGVASVRVELLLDADADRVLADIKSAVDRITSFPLDAEEPTISLQERSDIPVTLVVHGDVPEAVIRDIAEDARAKLIADDRLTKVELRAPPAREINIEVPQSALRAYNLSIQQIAAAVSAASVELPGGGVKTRAGEVLVRTAERRSLGSEFRDIVVASRPDGSEVRISDIGQVIDGFAESGAKGIYNGKPAYMVQLYRVGSETPQQVAAALNDFIDNNQDALPAGVGYAIWGDFSKAYDGRVKLLLKNAGLGLVLVILVLGAFLNVRLAFWVTLGIPISFIGAVLLMQSLDVTFNMISLFAFIVVLGMVVDDAIVVGESIYKRRQEGASPMAAAISGVRLVAVPVVFSVLTTVVAFLIFLFVPGVSGKFLRNIPLIVIAVLTISLVESLIILPAHLAHIRVTPEKGMMGVLHRMQSWSGRTLERLIDTVYAPLVRRATERRYLTLAVAVSALFCSCGLPAGGHLGFEFLPQIERDNVDINIKMPYGTPRHETEAVVQRIIEACDRVVEDNGGDEVLRLGLFSSIGFGGQTIGRQGGDERAQVSLLMPEIDVRAMSAGDFANLWREEIGEIPGLESMTFEAARGPGRSRGLDLELSHPDIDQLAAASAELAQAMAGYTGVVDVDDGFTRGKEQLSLKVRPEARTLGISAAEMGRQLRGAFFGQEALRQQRGRDEVRVYVRRPRSERSTEYSLENFLLRTPDGGEVPLRVAADIERGHAYTEIERKDGRRIVHVTADIDKTMGANANRIVGSIEARDMPGLLEKYPGLSYRLGGSQASQARTMDALRTNVIIAFGLIFVMLGVVFRSYLQPIVVMSAIPFGVIGAIIGHVVMGYNMSLISMMGMVALSGVVINDSLVLIDAVNKYRREGRPALEAVQLAGVRRFRPIMLTSLTTFFGLAPMLTETSVQARFLIPMAISLAFGILFATALILLCVPAGYMVVEDVVGRLRRGYSWLTTDGEGPQQQAAE